MTGPDIFFAIFFSLFMIGVAGMMVWGAIVGTEEWRDKRALVRLARSYGIEYVPGENIETLRAKVLAKRDASER